MSQAFALHQDENQVARRGKMTTRSTGLGGQKRAALGVITNQVNQVRVQPSRAAKPKVRNLFLQYKSSLFDISVLFLFYLSSFES